MPQRSDIMRYKKGGCFEITLDISDAPDAIFQSATLCRGKSKTIWPLIKTKKIGRCEFRAAPDLLTLHLAPRLPKGHADDPNLPFDEILGQLHVKLTYKDPETGSTRECVTKQKVIPCATSTCDTCEATENLHNDP